MHPRDRTAPIVTSIRLPRAAVPKGTTSGARFGLPRALSLALALLLAHAPLARAQSDSLAADTTSAALAPSAGTDAPAGEAPASADPAPAGHVRPAPVVPPAAAPPEAAKEPAAPAREIVRPADLRHVEEWVDYRAAAHLAALPDEARIFFRRGLMARQAGQPEAAVLDVRGAADLDPSFVEPHLTLAAWTLTKEPSQALLQYATVVDLLRQNFNLQLNLVANATILLLDALFVGLLAAGILVVWLRRRELTHGWQEDLGRFASLRTAKLWAPVLVLLPYLLGFGLTLPTLFFLGWLWPHLRVRERSLFVLLVAMVLATPLLLRTVERMSLPLHEGTGPFYAVPTLENRPYDEHRETQLRAMVVRDPQNPIVQFGLAWTSRRGGHLDAAEQAYRRVLALWPSSGEAWNNLGNVVAMAGRPDEALECYAKSVAADPASAAPHYNASQLYTQRFEYAKATESLSKATAINFELVKTYQSQATTDGLLPLVDEWLPPAVFWQALSSAGAPRDAAGSLPGSRRRHIETRGWPFSVAGLVLAVLGVVLGLRQHRTLPLRTCGNCGAVVCRRCAERRRESALCATCVAVEATAESGEFSRLMLSRHRMAEQRRAHLFRIGLATLIPGYGLLSHRHVFTAIGLLATTRLLLRAWMGTPPPFAIEPRLTMSAAEVPPVLLLAVFALVLAVSVLGYLGLRARERAREAALAASQRGRITQSTRRITPAAA